MNARKIIESIRLALACLDELPDEDIEGLADELMQVDDALNSVPNAATLSAITLDDDAGGWCSDCGLPLDESGVCSSALTGTPCTALVGPI